MTRVYDILTAASNPDFDARSDLQSAISGNHNLLLEGPNDWTEVMLRYLTPLLGAPVLWATCQAFRLPGPEGGSLVVRDIGALHPHDQGRLLKWMDEGGRQVISTAVHPLFAAVAETGFDEALYYRLNVVRICALDHSGGSTGVPGLQRPAC